VSTKQNGRCQAIRNDKYVSGMDTDVTTTDGTSKQITKVTPNFGSRSRQLIVNNVN